MNTISEHHRKLAATLTSLSLEPISGKETDKPGRNPGISLLVGLSVLAVIVIAIGLSYRSDVFRHIGSMALTTVDPTGEPAANGVSIPEKSSTAKDWPEARPDPVSPPVSATRDVSGSGYVVAPRTTTVFSKYEGRIVTVAVELGDFVEAGQVLAILDDAGARFALEQAKAAKIAAEISLAARIIDLDQARSSLDRTEKLAAREATSKQQLEEARRAIERADNSVAKVRQELAAAELAIRIAQEPIRELTVRAPITGTVARLDAHVGDTALARVDSVRESQSLVTIVDKTVLVIDADVAETNIAPLRPGLRGEAVLDGFPDRPFPVEVRRLAPIASAEKGTLTLRLSLTDPPEGIRPNMAARIRIPLIDTVTTTGDVKQ